LMIRQINQAVSCNQLTPGAAARRVLCKRLPVYLLNFNESGVRARDGSRYPKKKTDT
jgi:hypothetical protein